MTASDPHPRKRIAVLDTQMSYVDVGEGEPIVFLHGNQEDGQTFLHLVTSRDDPSAVITGLPSFKKFQSELLASDPVVSPDQVGMSLVATSGDSYG
jgi:pimeloyl-ACP methyl ester carboxylesterase